MERVLGLGGFFFDSPDPAALAQWYETNLGVTAIATSYDADVWEQQSDPTVYPNGRFASLRDPDGNVVQL